MSQLDIPRTLESISQTLIPNTNLVHPPKKPQDAQLTATIADLHVHPTIETLLHILNHDLPSAHFLVRHMQAPPAVEGMLLHGILHRAEGDFDNARAWVGDVADACEGYQPKHKEEGQKLDAEVAKQVGSNSSISASLIEFVYGDQLYRLTLTPARIRKNGKWSKKKIDRANDEDGIENRIRAEAEKVLEWCKNKFGDGVFDDATKAWVKNSEEISKISGDMVSGGKGHRKF